MWFLLWVELCVGRVCVEKKDNLGLSMAVQGSGL